MSIIANVPKCLIAKVHKCLYREEELLITETEKTYGCQPPKISPDPSLSSLLTCAPSHYRPSPLNIFHNKEDRKRTKLRKNIKKKVIRRNSLYIPFPNNSKFSLTLGMKKQIAKRPAEEAEELTP